MQHCSKFAVNFPTPTAGLYHLFLPFGSLAAFLGMLMIVAAPLTSSSRRAGSVPALGRIEERSVSKSAPAFARRWGPRVLPDSSSESRIDSSAFNSRAAVDIGLSWTGRYSHSSVGNIYFNGR
jgi:hypothetical protein